MPAKDEIPSTLKRSPQHAQDVYAAALDSANETYGPGERAHRTAFAAVKHEYEKGRRPLGGEGVLGPSPLIRCCRHEGSGRTEGGVDANASKEHLMEVARRLDVHGRSTMDKGGVGRGDRQGERPGDGCGAEVVVAAAGGGGLGVEDGVGVDVTAAASAAAAVSPPVGRMPCSALSPRAEE